jgi:hypothetical protein
MHYLLINKLLYAIYIIDTIFISEQRNSQTINGINRAEQSGEVLRGVIRTNIFASQTNPLAGSAQIPEIEMTSVQSTDEREIPRYWGKVYSCTSFVSMSIIKMQ